MDCHSSLTEQEYKWVKEVRPDLPVLRKMIASALASTLVVSTRYARTRPSLHQDALCQEIEAHFSSDRISTDFDSLAIQYTDFVLKFKKQNKKGKVSCSPTRRAKLMYGVAIQRQLFKISDYQDEVTKVSDCPTVILTWKLNESNTRILSYEIMFGQSRGRYLVSETDIIGTANIQSFRQNVVDPAHFEDMVICNKNETLLEDGNLLSTKPDGDSPEEAGPYTDAVGF